jgi:hypothetical protein|mmetsp:Transcript_20822/g.37622  ORF Transcript_20822/g.37622 Transcript_20822/m.37622 type:complete len:207 (-) Transcript_20822:65-685(-)|eukprot:CAMPEP_0198296776 /NCGR_PEP_ID=MMETSP1449-20131203/33890_1 /TAXON_ID=420275 /ORGANISM="Attheya septentrionalis, Strain CCMP2084" /LENGTH=206 /DNA_ID=CAMNT_0043997491 /DNA_START=106 /DNA_END=726 /DNA_ORIENTATION=+
MSSNQDGATPQKDSSSDHRAPAPPAFLERIVSSSTVLQNFVDEQRLFRLEKCTELDQALQACIARQTDQQAPSRDETNASESVSMKKIARYYQWNTSASASSENNTSTNNESKGGIEPCAMETHAVWACRAIGLGCANYMMDLRGCFQEAQENGEAASTSVMINPSYDDSMTGPSVCKAQQQRMAACVQEKAAALDARLKIVKESQ